MIARVIKALEISRGVGYLIEGGGGGCGLARNSSGMYVVREILSSKKEGLVYRWLNFETCDIIIARDVCRL